jgi:hypothetical protein
MFLGRYFTPDGNVFGRLGESLVVMHMAFHFNLHQTSNCITPANGLGPIVPRCYAPKLGVKSAIRS